jgi:hypothetical protein
MNTVWCDEEHEKRDLRGHMLRSLALTLAVFPLFFVSQIAVGFKEGTYAVFSTEGLDASAPAAGAAVQGPRELRLVITVLFA